MSRYVDAEWLIKESMPLSFSVQKWVNEVQIMTAPSINIVRCKECGRTAKRSTQYEGKKYCSVLVGWVDDDFYCGYGEVRDE